MLDGVTVSLQQQANVGVEVTLEGVKVSLLQEEKACVEVT